MRWRQASAQRGARTPAPEPTAAGLHCSASIVGSGHLPALAEDALGVCAEAPVTAAAQSRAGRPGSPGRTPGARGQPDRPAGVPEPSPVKVRALGQWGPGDSMDKEGARASQKQWPECEAVPAWASLLPRSVIPSSSKPHPEMLCRAGVLAAACSFSSNESSLLAS